MVRPFYDILIHQFHEKTREFGCTETKHFIYFYIGPLAILIWKS
jgi:hypothetical protein